MLREAGGLAEVADAEALAQFVSRMLKDPVQRDAMAQRAVNVARAHGGLADRTADRLLNLLRQD